jgi:membrane protein DedA with SNARE-associated domain
VTPENVIIQFGYPAILVGTFLEGETILVIAGMAAHRGYLDLPLVIGAAFIGTLFGDQLFFFLGRRHSEALLKRRPSWMGRVEKVRGLLNRYQTSMILFFRFLYGLRTVTPFAIGMSRVPAWKFLIFNTIGALAWAVAVGCGGYFFGHTVEMILGDIKRYEIWVFSGVAAAGAILWVAHFYRKKKGEKRSG